MNGRLTALLGAFLCIGAATAQTSSQSHPNEESKKYPVGSSQERKARMTARANSRAYEKEFDLSALPRYVAESQATQSVLGSRTAISSLKSYMGHTLGACGALETWMTLEMMKAGWFAPTLNLQQVDPRCGDLDYVLSGGRKLETEFAMTNNFAFGGINTSLILRRL